MPTGSHSGVTVTRRPVLSVRRRIINAPATTGAAAATTLPTSASNSGGDPTTTESAATSKYSRLRSRPAAAAAATTITSLYASPTIATTFANRNVLNTKLKSTKFPASTAAASADLNTASSTATSSSSASTNDITQRQSTKFPSTVLRRNKFQTRRFTTTTTASATDETNEQPRTQNPLFKRRFGHTTNVLPALLTASNTSTAITAQPTALDTLTTTLYVDGADTDEDTDQVAKSSIHSSHFNKITVEPFKGQTEEETSDLASAIQVISNAPPTTLTQTSYTFEEAITRRMGTAAATAPTTTTIKPTTARKPAVRRRPQKTTPTPPQSQARPDSTQNVVRRRRPHKYADTFDRLNGNQPTPVKTPSQAPGRTYRPTVDYDYYDDEDVRVVGKTQGQLKVILHGRGIIECLDQGNFPHPLSCRKFISCAKFETGGVVGWEYTCPKGLSYDPVGGMCNWAAGLGCKE